MDARPLPQVPVNSLDSETRTGFGLYNQHLHATAAHSSLMIYGVQPGDSVSGYENDLPLNTLVLEVLVDGGIILTEAARASTITDLSIEGRLISGCILTQGSALVRRAAYDGFMPSALLKKVLTRVIPGQLRLYSSSPSEVQQTIYPILMDSALTGCVTRLSVVLNSPSQEISVRLGWVNTTEEGTFLANESLSVLASSTPNAIEFATQTTTQNTALSQGDTLAIVVGAPPEIDCTLNYNLTLVEAL